MDENVKARQAERANLEPRPGKEGRARKALKEKRRSEKGTPAPAA